MALQQCAQSYRNTWKASDGKSSANSAMTQSFTCGCYAASAIDILVSGFIGLLPLRRGRFFMVVCNVNTPLASHVFRILSELGRIMALLNLARVVVDRGATPAEIAACRIDFAGWRRLLTSRRRRIALTLAGGETTSATARKFGLSAGRVSQLRLWLREQWLRFQGEANPDQQLKLAVA